MKYMLLIHQGTTPTPRDPEAWAQLSEDQQKAVFQAYQALNQTPGVTPGMQMQAPETATTVRVQDGKTLTTDGPFVELKEAIGGYLFYEADDLDAAIELAARIPGRKHGRGDRGAPDRGVVAILEQTFREQWGRVLAALIGFLGDFDLAEEAVQEAFAIAAERWPRDGTPTNPGAWLIDDRAQPRDQPDPARPDARCRRRGCSTCPRRWRTRWTPKDFRTSDSSSSSPAAIRRSRSMRRSRSRCGRSAA